jgi:tRNA(Ile)-lysidine synthase
VATRAIEQIDVNYVTFKVSEFKKVNNPKAYLFEMFKDYGFSEWNDVVNLLEAETGKYVASNTHKLTKHREFLILTELCHSEQSEESLFVAKDNPSVKTPIGILYFDDQDTLEDNSKTTIFVDAEKLKYPLQVRKWQIGDVFYPIGMEGKKKVSKYLKDEKLTPIEKENTWILTSENKIVWVVGRRADERFKVSDQTNQILKIELKA